MIQLLVRRSGSSATTVAPNVPKIISDAAMNEGSVATEAILTTPSAAFWSNMSAAVLVLLLNRNAGYSTPV